MTTSQIVQSDLSRAEPRIAYSYIRFSSEKQQLGDSLRRQVSLAERYATEHGMLLDTDSYRDMGISAFRGRNAVEGKLALFLRAVDSELIPSDTYLLVESLDRLSRSEVDEALSLFLSIIKRGVTVVTLVDGHEYSTATIKADHGISLIVSITIMMRAHEESLMKRVRCEEAWRARTARGGILTKRCPSWIRYDDGQWRVDRKRADVVRRIYRMYLSGQGCHVISRILNEKGVAPLRAAGYWTHGLVSDVLRSPSVYGTMTRLRADDIENYYPAIVSRADFDRSQMIAKARLWRGETRGNHESSLLLGIARCGKCGTRVQMTGGKRGTYLLRCVRSNAMAGCDAGRVSCRTAEKAILEDLLSPRHAVSKTVPGALEAADALKAAEKSQQALQEKRDTLIQLALATGNVPAVAQQIVEIEGQLSAGLTQVMAYRSALAPRRSRDLGEARRLSAALTNERVTEVDRTEALQALKPILRRLFASVLLHPDRQEIDLEYHAGERVTVGYELLPRGFQKGHGGVARWGAPDRRVSKKGKRPPPQAVGQVGGPSDNA